MNKDNLILDEVFRANGVDAYTSEYVSLLRDSPERKEYIIPNEGHQEQFITTPAQIAIYAGKRMAGKTAALLMAAYPYVDKEYFQGVIFRNEKNDSNGTGGIASQSKIFYKSFGIYKSSLSNMSWDYTEGGTLSFEYYSDSYNDFAKRFRGKEFPFIGIDEITQIPFMHFTFLFSTNRNPYGYTNRIRATCNPDGDSWVYDFVRGGFRDKNNQYKLKYLDAEGFPIPENNGKILYFFKYGDRPDECWWGETKEDVYRQGKNRMDRIFNSDPDFMKTIKHPMNLALSFTLISGEVSDNKFAMANGGEYIGKLAAMGGENVEKDLLGRWVKSTDSQSLVSANDMEAFFYNSEKQSSEFRCITADMSGNGRNDPAVLFYWEGFNLCDIKYLQVGAETLKIACDEFMAFHNVARDHFCFDATSLGSTYEEYFNGCIAFIATLSAFDKKMIKVGNRKQEVSNYENVRAQVFDLLATRIRARGYSIDEHLLNEKYGDKMAIDHFREEYPAIAKVQSNEYKFQAIKKATMISKVGHSPNFIDAWTMREYIDQYYKNKKKEIKRIGAYML